MGLVSTLLNTLVRVTSMCTVLVEGQAVRYIGTGAAIYATGTRLRGFVVFLIKYLAYIIFSSDY